MGHSTHDEFFSKLAEIFTSRKAKSHGAIFLTQKRLSYNPSSPSQQPTPAATEQAARDALEEELHPSQPLPILIRATNGKSAKVAKPVPNKPRNDKSGKIKLSTVVQPDELEGFYARYAEVCKAGMAALKPRDRTKTKRKAKAKKRKGGAAGAA
ncbi:signal recognition particle, SRP14 subunit [Chaetomium sp. MPI-SDFR-AT-0129]|nr:signal recognition particle, SRP14 subunit [Chaetomium sp. MPI-SDFR-AT-0129]